MQKETKIQYSVFLFANSKWNAIKHFDSGADAVRMCFKHNSKNLAIFKTSEGKILASN